MYQGGFNAGAEVIGIVGDVRFGTLDSTARPDTYISYNQARLSRMMIFVRTKGDPLALAPTVRAAVKRFAPRQPIYDIRAMSARVATASAQARFSALLLALFAGAALMLAMTGIYGVMSFGVAQRMRELGIRAALGANRSHLLRMILTEGVLFAAVGVGVGSIAALSFTRVLRSMLFEVTTTDWPTYALTILLLVVSVLLACWIPARRAARVDPMTALRNS